MVLVLVRLRHVRWPDLELRCPPKPPSFDGNTASMRYAIAPFTHRSPVRDYLTGVVVAIWSALSSSGLGSWHR